MKILSLTNLYPTGKQPRGGVFVDHRLRALGTDEHSCLLVDLGYTVLSRHRSSTRTEPLGPSVQSRAFTPGILPHEWAGLRSRPAGPRLTRRYARQLRATLTDPFDVIHAHGMFGITAGGVAAELSKLLQIPYVVTLHGSDINVHMKDRAPFFAEILDGAASCIFVSEALRDSAIKQGVRPRPSLKVIPNGVNSTIFHPGPTTPAGHWKPYEVTYIGNLVEIKGADRLPRIIHHILENEPATTFRIIGTGPLKAHLAHQLAHLPVTFTGPLPPEEVAEEMRRSDLVILPSRNEGWPTVVLEAYACGTPVVATDVGGSGEALGPFGPAVSNGQNLEVRFAQECLERLYAAPGSNDLVEHAQDYEWTRVVTQELTVLSDSVRAGR